MGGGGEEGGVFLVFLGPESSQSAIEGALSVHFALGGKPQNQKRIIVVLLCRAFMADRHDCEGRGVKAKATHHRLSWCTASCIDQTERVTSKCWGRRGEAQDLTEQAPEAEAF